jgi:hypothetical protein
MPVKKETYLQALQVSGTKTCIPPLSEDMLAGKVNVSASASSPPVPQPCSGMLAFMNNIIEFALSMKQNTHLNKLEALQVPRDKWEEDIYLGTTKNTMYLG